MDIVLSDIEVHGREGHPLFRLPELRIPAGQTLLLEGASGKGKTTLLHLIAGLFPPRRGEVRVGDHELGALSEEARAKFRRRHLGLVFQKLNLLDFLSAAENVALGAVDGRPGADAVARCLEAVGLSQRADARTRVLSLGEQQRVAVARVLLRRPEIILADEPTSSLDDANAARVMDALFAAAAGRTLVVVSHDQRIRSRFARAERFEELVRV